MLDSNLLPPEEKIHLAHAMRLRALLGVGGGFFVVFLIATVLLVPTILLLTFQKFELVRRVAIETENVKRVGIAEQARELTEANKFAEMVNQMEEKRRFVSPLIASVIQSIPSGLRLESLRFHVAAGELILAGFAPHRASFLQFIHALEKNPRIATVSSPVSNVIKEVDIVFSIIAKVK